MTIPVTAPLARMSWKAIDVSERNGRVFYPTLRSGLLPGAADDSPATATVSFLFTGDGPLELTILAPRPIQFTLVPSARPPRIFRRQLTRWWRDYNAALRQDSQLDDYPQLTNVYLASMLGRRLGLEPPLLSRNPRNAGSELQQTLELLSGAEGLREHLAHEMLQSLGEERGGRLPLPADVTWSPNPMPDPADPSIAVEPMARHVPAECFYVRFGRFSNYLWLNRLLQEHGGDIGRMISLRGQDPKLNQKTQDQLALKQGKLAEIFGGQVIEDVALIGRDVYLAEGAAIGVLFQAKSNLALSTDLRQQRKVALEAASLEGGTLETIQIAGQSVSYLSTPDNRLRSFYVVDGNFHLVTTSRTIARRFLEAGQGQGALGDSLTFQLARQGMPLERGDTVFAFFSPEFFQALISPGYQIGLRRRLQADSAIVLVQLAALTAQNEGLADSTLDQLIAAQLLPPGFGRIADGSGPILSTIEVVDSLRGTRGSFTPIPDLPIRTISTSEAEWYRRVSSYFQQNWRQMDPLIVGIKRHTGDEPGAERIIVDANVSPLAEEKYGWILSLLGPPSTHAVRTAPDDIIAIQAMVKGGLVSSRIPPHHLFMGIKDTAMPLEPLATGVLETFKLLRTTPGYLGSWPKLGFLDWLPGLARQPDAAGFSPLPLGAWRWQGSGFSVVSFQHDVLASAVPQLDVVPTTNPAQIRVRIGDLSRSQLASWINARNYDRAFRTSLGNVRFMRLLGSQFGVADKEARSVAERLVNSELVCALGGKYELAQQAGRSEWRSTAWQGSSEYYPAEYLAPIMRWFRGAELELVKTADRLVMQVQLDLHRATAPSKPFFDLFGGSKSPSGPPEASRVP